MAACDDWDTKFECSEWERSQWVADERQKYSIQKRQASTHRHPEASRQRGLYIEEARLASSAKRSPIVPVRRQILIRVHEENFYYGI